MISTKLVDPTLSTENNKILIIGISGLKEFHEFKRFLSFNQLIERGIYNISEKLICQDKSLLNDLEIIFNNI